MDIEELRLRGNKLYAASEFESAIDVYTQALEIDPNNSIILGNRSACYLALWQPEKAEVDARKALLLDPAFVKCYFRLATALKARNEFDEAIAVADLGLQKDPQSAALRHLKQSCIKEKLQAKSQSQQDDTSSSSISIKRGFLASSASGGSGSGNTNSSNFRNNKSQEHSPMCGECGGPGSSSSIYEHQQAIDDADESLNPLETRMMGELKTLIKRIISGNYGTQEINNHMLDGIFKQLMDRTSFSELLFPGAPQHILDELPRNLRELLCWDVMSLDLHYIATKAASIYTGITTKGAQRGDFMDATTEAILVPQIVEEAFAREVVDTVRKLGKRVSGLNAKVALALASPDDEEATWNQLDDEIPLALVNPLEAIAVQDSFLDTEWASLVMEDVIRYVNDEKMSAMSDTVHPMMSAWGDGDSGSDGRSVGDVAKKQPISATMSWIECDAVEEGYPALAQAIQQLHALPFEINAKSNCALNLLQPSRGCTMLMRFMPGSKQQMRFDNQEGDFDSGIRVTCAYHLVPAAKNGTTQPSSSPSSQCAIVPAGYGAPAKLYTGMESTKPRSLDVEHDRLVLHQSVKIRNERSESVGEYYVLFYFIHGK